MSNRPAVHFWEAPFDVAQGVFCERGYGFCLRARTSDFTTPQLPRGILTALTPSTSGHRPVIRGDLLRTSLYQLSRSRVILYRALPPHWLFDHATSEIWPLDVSECGFCKKVYGLGKFQPQSAQTPRSGSPDRGLLTSAGEFET